MLLLSCYYILLEKYTSQDDIIVGTPIVGREIADTYNLIGMFVNTVPVRINNQPCILYEQYNDEAICETFRALSYNGAGTLYIHNGIENWIILSKGWYFLSPSYMEAGWK